MSSTKHGPSQFSLKMLLIGVAILASVFGAYRYASHRPIPKVNVKGRVVYGFDGRLNGLPGIRVVVQAQRVDSESPSASKRVFTDNQGYYLLPDLPEGKYNIWAVLDGFVVKALDSQFCGDETAVPDLRLIRGGTISGRVVDAETGALVKIPKSLRGFIGLYGPSRPESGSGIAIAPIMDDGTFFIRAAPGKNHVYLTGINAIENGRYVTIETWVDVTDGQMIEVELKVPSKDLAE